MSTGNTAALARSGVVKRSQQQPAEQQTLGELPLSATPDSSTEKTIGGTEPGGFDDDTQHQVTDCLGEVPSVAKINANIKMGMTS